MVYLVNTHIRKKKYIKAIEETKSIISRKLYDIDCTFISNFDSIKNNVIKELNLPKEVEIKDIYNMNIPDWK